MLLAPEFVRRAALGGAVLGGGGGGSTEDGIALGTLATSVGEPRLINLEELHPEALVVTVSAVGAPAATEAYLKPADYVAVLTTINERLDGKVAGIISSENGGLSSLNGWFQSAMTGIPVVDAACNGRAHPTGVMGSMGLDLVDRYRSVQSAVGGDPSRERRVSVSAEGSLAVVDHLMRQAAVQAGGMVAVARNPVSARYIAENGAPGAISQALELGALIEKLEGEGGQAVAESLADRLGGKLLAQGEVTDYDLRTEGGYDLGRLSVGGVALTFWNEYMTAERDGERLATFPDLITTLDARSGIPVSSAELSDGRRVFVLAAPKERLILGAGVRRAEALRPVEAVLGVELSRYFG